MLREKMIIELKIGNKNVEQETVFGFIVSENGKPKEEVNG